MILVLLAAGCASLGAGGLAGWTASRWADRRLARAFRQLDRRSAR